MDRLPAEIKQEIIRLLIKDSPNLACTYTPVSREWQALIEPTTFASLQLNQERLPQAERIVTPLRQAYVRQIYFTALLPGYDNHRDPETESEAKQNNEAFTDAVTSLMTLLRSWSGDIELQFIAACRIDLRDLGKMIPGKSQISHIRERRRRCISSYVALPEGVYCQLPEVSCIKKFTSASVSPMLRRVTPKTCCEIANRFRNLHTIDWTLADGSHDPAFRVQLRKEFATGLSLLPESVRHFTLKYNAGPFDHYLHPEYNDLRLNPEDRPDPLSVALRSFSMPLETISLQMTIGSELFWAPDLDQDHKAHWLRLRVVNISFAGRTPQGDHLLDWDRLHILPDHVTEISDLDRFIPIPTRMNPYHLAFARAAERMPNLELFLAMWGHGYGCITYDVRREGPNNLGVRAEFLYEDSPVPHLAQEIQEAWWEAACIHIRKGGEFLFEVKESEDLFRAREYRTRHHQSPDFILGDPAGKIIEWTRVV